MPMFVQTNDFLLFHIYSTTIWMQDTCACFTRISTPENSFGGETQNINYSKSNKNEMKCNSLVLLKSILQKRNEVKLIGSMKINCPRNPHGQRDQT